MRQKQTEMNSFVYKTNKNKNKQTGLIIKPTETNKNKQVCLQNQHKQTKTKSFVYPKSKTDGLFTKTNSIKQR